MAQNIGVYGGGSGPVTVHGDAIGQQNVYGAGEPAGPPPHADIGVLTVLTEEIQAVAQVLRQVPSYHTHPLPSGTQVHEAHIGAIGGPVHVVAIQTTAQGQESAVLGFQQLRQHYAPPVVLLVGIAGGIGAEVAIGDVVIVDEVICYDARRDTPDGPRRRGRSQPVPAVLRNRVNAYFEMYGTRVQLPSGAGFGVYRGPIGSGGAVVADADSDIRRFLSAFNDKTLAVETESAGVAQAYYETVAADPTVQGWLAIRGISDHADRHKGHGDHRLAAEHAAAVMARLLPLLRLSSG